MVVSKITLKQVNCLRCGIGLESTGGKFCASCSTMRVKPVRRKFGSEYVPGSFTLEEWDACQRQYGNVCLRCGLSGPLTRDHVIPLSVKGSTNYISNIQPLCFECNLFKYAETVDYRSEDDHMRIQRWNRLKEAKVLDALSLRERTFAWTSYEGRNIKVVVFLDRFEVEINGELELRAKEILPLEDDFIREHAYASVVSKIDRVALTKEQEDKLITMQNKLRGSMIKRDGAIFL